VWNLNPLLSISKLVDVVVPPEFEFANKLYSIAPLNPRLWSSIYQLCVPAVALINMYAGLKPV